MVATLDIFMLSEYREKVRLASRKKTGEPIYNGSLDHAKILVEELLSSATKEVCIYSGCLDAKVYGGSKVRDSLRTFLGNPKRKVKLIVESPNKIDFKDHPIFVEFRESDDLELREVNKILGDRYKFHFTVVDLNSYRFEADKGQPSAIAAFGDKVGGEKLQEFFDIFWDASTPVDKR